MLAGLHCSPGSSPSSVWPAAKHFFVRPLALVKVLHQFTIILPMLLVSGGCALPPGSNEPSLVHEARVYRVVEILGSSSLRFWSGPEAPPPEWYEFPPDERPKTMELVKTVEGLLAEPATVVLYNGNLIVKGSDEDHHAVALYLKRPT